MENAPITKVPEVIQRPKVSQKKSIPEPTLQTKFVSAGLAACFADLITFPLDTAKVRLQIQGEGTAPITGSVATSGPRYRGLVGTICTVSKHEGPKALYNGLAAGLQRQMCFASVRIGLYDVVKLKYSKAFKGVDPNSPNFVLRIMAGSTTGAMAVMCAQPTDVVKVRMQAQAAGVKKYRGVFQAYRIIAVEEGLKGLWKGASPNIARNVVVNCCELVSYDLIKEKLLHSGFMNDHIGCHFSSACGAGFITTIVASPIDVVKTRFMNSGAGTYSGVLNCAASMLRKEGPKAFYKGFVPSFSRMASWNVIMFVCYEQLKIVLSQRPSLPSISIEPKRFM